MRANSDLSLLFRYQNKNQILLEFQNRTRLSLRPLQQKRKLDDS